MVFKKEHVETGAVLKTDAFEFGQVDWCRFLILKAVNPARRHAAPKKEQTFF